MPHDWVCDEAHTGPPSGLPEATGLPAADAPPPRLSERVNAALEVLLCSGFPTQLTIMTLLAVVGIPVFDGSGQLSLRHVALLSLFDTLVVVGLILLFLHRHREAPSPLFLGNRPVGRELLLGVGLIPATFLLVGLAVLVIDATAPWLRNPNGNPLADLLRRWPDILLFAAIGVIAGGFREELQRGFVLHRFRSHLGGAVPGLIIFSTAFGAGHLVQGADAAILTGLLGAAWGGLFLWRGSVVAPIVCHSAFNVIEVVSYGLTT